MIFDSSAANGFARFRRMKDGRVRESSDSRGFLRSFRLLRYEIHCDVFTLERILATSRFTLARRGERGGERGGERHATCRGLDMNNEKGRRLEERRLHQRRRQASLPGAEDALSRRLFRVKERSFMRILVRKRNRRTSS